MILKQNMKRHNYYCDMKIAFDFPSGLRHPSTFYFIEVSGALQFFFVVERFPQDRH